MKTQKHIAMAGILAVCAITLAVTACDNGTTPSSGSTNQNPVVADFNISGTGTFTYDGNPKVVTVTAKEGKTSGAITIKYNGNPTAPSAVGTYTVTFDVTETTGWNAVSGLSAGTLTIHAANPNNQTPVAADFNISGTGTFTYDGNPKSVTVTAKEDKTSGAITVKYNGDIAAPSAVGTYTVTFDVTEAAGWNSASGLSAGTLTIDAANSNNQTPVAADFNISGTGTFIYDGNPKTVTVTAKDGKTSGAITVKYNGEATAPSAVGTYTVTFDVLEATGWNSAIGLAAGTLTINPIPTYTITFDADNGNPTITQTVTEGSEATKPANPTKDGYNFVYWFNIATDTEWDFNTTITDNIDLKAKWISEWEIIKENAIPLSFNTWAEGDENLWFYFTATATTQYIHIDCNTAMNPGFSVYDNDRTEIGQYPSYTYGGGFGSRSVTIAQTYYINMRQISSGQSYKIAFNDSNVPPAITLPDSGITQLTHNTWTDGELTSSNRVQWYSFTAITDTEYIHCSGLDAYIRLYDHNGVAVGNGVNTAGGTSFSRNVITGQLYYIKIWSTWSSGFVAYKIACNSSNAQPPITLPTENINQLSLNTWTNGEIIGEDQWYQFTATANTHYVHLNEGTMWLGYMQLYDSNGVTVGERVYNSFPSSFSRAVTIGNEYYVRVYPYSPTLKGTYQIAVTESNRPPAITLPTADINQLTENTWFDGEIVSSTERQWFSFTASASTQYIHFIFNAPLSNLGIKVYDDSGVMVLGRGTDAYNTRTSISVTDGNVYYFEVWHISEGGTYKAAFNTTTTPPSP